jgi:RNA polymerase sigma factor (sigma-70 family)
VTDSHQAPEIDALAQRFELERPHLRAVAYRMLGSFAEADDVVQDAWLRLRRADTTQVENLRGWLTTVVARLCLDALRTRKARREDLVGFRLPDAIVTPDDRLNPEQQALLADSIGLAMLVVLDELSPPERLAFVLHDVFAVPFTDIAPIVERTPEAARQLASRARRRVQHAAPSEDVDVARQRELVDAFLAASRAGDFDALIVTLDPDVVLRADYGRALAVPTEIRGARNVIAQAASFRNLAPGARRATINGAPGIVVFSAGKPYALLSITTRNDRIAEIFILADPERLARLDFGALAPASAQR